MSKSKPSKRTWTQFTEAGSEDGLSIFSFMGVQPADNDPPGIRIVYGHPDSSRKRTLGRFFLPGTLGGGKECDKDASKTNK